MFPSGSMGGLALPLGVAITIVVDTVGSRYLGSGADAGSGAGAAYIGGGVTWFWCRFCSICGVVDRKLW